MNRHARIGPNAVIQLAAALDAQAPEMKHAIFKQAQVAHWLTTPPQDMVDEQAVARLHQSLRDILPEKDARILLDEAGLRTADYIFTHRIPRLFRLLLPHLPTALAARLLLAAITRHAWTFAGSGDFSGRYRAGIVVALRDNPLCRGEHRPEPVCAWHAGVFTGLFSRLVAPHCRALEFTCCAAGDDACRFVIDWPPAQKWIQIKAHMVRMLAIFFHFFRGKTVSKDQSLAP